MSSDAHRPRSAWARSSETPIATRRRCARRATSCSSQTRRQTMMQGQIEVLQGKQRALQRFHDRLAQILPALGQAGPALDAAGAAALVGEAEVSGASEVRYRAVRATSWPPRSRCAARSRARCTTARRRASPTSRSRRRSYSASSRAIRVRPRRSWANSWRWSRRRSSRPSASSSTSGPWFSTIWASCPRCAAPPPSAAADRLRASTSSPSAPIAARQRDRKRAVPDR